MSVLFTCYHHRYYYCLFLLFLLGFLPITKTINSALTLSYHVQRF